MRFSINSFQVHDISITFVSSVGGEYIHEILQHSIGEGQVKDGWNVTLELLNNNYKRITMFLKGSITLRDPP
jgi:hypothetical protein